VSNFLTADQPFYANTTLTRNLS